MSDDGHRTATCNFRFVGSVSFVCHVGGALREGKVHPVAVNVSWVVDSVGYNALSVGGQSYKGTTAKCDDDYGIDAPLLFAGCLMKGIGQPAAIFILLAPYHLVVTGGVYSMRVRRCQCSWAVDSVGYSALSVGVSHIKVQDGKVTATRDRRSLPLCWMCDEEHRAAAWVLIETHFLLHEMAGGLDRV